MQEEVENKTIALAINGTKFTGRMFKAAIAKYLAHRKEVKAQKARDGPVKPCGKQSVKELIGQNQGVSNVEVTDPSIRQFDRVARKYGVDYAIKRDKDHDPPRFLIFFKSRDADAITAAFTEYNQQKVKKASRPSVLQKLAQFKDTVRDTGEKIKKKVLER
ncbi:MAG: PcfB family protein [Dysosmobacter sp.]|nr:PcfB family protein [Dysosmobacter sp.]